MEVTLKNQNMQNRIPDKDYNTSWCRTYSIFLQHIILVSITREKNKSYVKSKNVWFLSMLCSSSTGLRGGRIIQRLGANWRYLQGSTSPLKNTFLQYSFWNTVLFHWIIELWHLRSRLSIKIRNNNESTTSTLTNQWYNNYCLNRKKFSSLEFKYWQKNERIDEI